jgi:hypothetical protein
MTREARRAALGLAALTAAALAIAWATGGLAALERTLAGRQAGAARNAVTEEIFAPVLAHPDFQTRAQGLDAAQQQALLFELARDGLPRLGDETLLGRLALLRDVAVGGDERTCAMVLIGGAPDAAGDVLAGLDEAMLRRWLELSRESVLAALRDDPARGLAVGEAERARAALVGAMTPEDAARFAGPLGGLSQGEACALARAMLDAAMGLPAEDRQLVARLFAGG